jgi:hypothetical protein
MRTALACTLAAGVAIAACGGSSAGAPLAAQDSVILRNDISAIRTASAANDPAAAHAAAARLRADVERLRGLGRLSATDSRSIVAASMRVDTRISAEVSPRASSAAPAPSSAAPIAPTESARTATTPAPSTHDRGPAQPKGHDHGHGGGKDGGD